MIWSIAEEGIALSLDRTIFFNGILLLSTQECGKLSTNGAFSKSTLVGN